MKIFAFPAAAALILLLLASGCSQPPGDQASYPGKGAQPATPPTVAPTPVTVSIHAEPGSYIPLMSSTVGIRLEPDFSGSAPVLYNWSASYGYFVSWNATDGRVTLHGDRILSFDPYIYWSYPPEDMGAEKPPVFVLLVVEPERVTHGGEGGRGTVATGRIRIGWKDMDTAVVTG